MLPDKGLVDLRQGVLVAAHNDGVVVQPEEAPVNRLLIFWNSGGRFSLLTEWKDLL